MPVYEYFCHECEATTEQVFKIADRKQFVPCPKCQGMAERIISSNIQRDEPVWLESACQNLMPTRCKGVKPIESRCEFNRYLKQNGIVQH